MRVAQQHTNIGKVVIVDDQDLELLLCKIVFQKIEPGVCLKTFQSGESVLAFLRQSRQKEPIDLILLDLKMPKMDGLEVLEFIRKEGLTNCPILIFSTSILDTDKERAKRLGADGFLEKPINIDQNIELFRELLDKYTDFIPGAIA